MRAHGAGATPASLRCLVLAKSAKLAIFGLAAGVPAALFSTRSITLLLGVTPFDPLTLIGVVFLLTLAALAAGFFPSAARHARRSHTITALRIA
jgi:hypothetical protein